MFVQHIVRARGSDPAEAILSARRFLLTTGDANNMPTLLAAFSYGIGSREGAIGGPRDSALRVMLVDKTDFRRRDREAAELLRELLTREDMILLAKKIRFQELFMLLGLTRVKYERAIYEKLRDEYLASVHDPRAEEVFLLATNGIVREVLTVTMEEPTDYLLRREELAKKLFEHSTPRSFPFVTATGLDLYDARLFDLGGEGDEHYVVASVHV